MNEQIKEEEIKHMIDNKNKIMEESERRALVISQAMDNFVKESIPRWKWEILSRAKNAKLAKLLGVVVTMESHISKDCFGFDVYLTVNDKKMLFKVEAGWMLKI